LRGSTWHGPWCSGRSRGPTSAGADIRWQEQPHSHLQWRVEKMRTMMLKAHYKLQEQTLVVLSLRVWNNDSKHWYLVKNKQVYSCTQWSTASENVQLPQTL
jgi:hypothetical protein